MPDVHVADPGEDIGGHCEHHELICLLDSRHIGVASRVHFGTRGPVPANEDPWITTRSTPERSPWPDAEDRFEALVEASGGHDVALLEDANVLLVAFIQTCSLQTFFATVLRDPGLSRKDFIAVQVARCWFVLLSKLHHAHHERQQHHWKARQGSTIIHSWIPKLYTSLKSLVIVGYGWLRMEMIMMIGMRMSMRMRMMRMMLMMVMMMMMMMNMMIADDDCDDDDG